MESLRNLFVAAMARWSEDSALPFGPPNACFGFAAPQRCRWILFCEHARRSMRLVHLSPFWRGSRRKSLKTGTAWNAKRKHRVGERMFAVVDSTVRTIGSAISSFGGAHEAVIDSLNLQRIAGDHRRFQMFTSLLCFVVWSEGDEKAGSGSLDADCWIDVRH